MFCCLVGDKPFPEPMLTRINDAIIMLLLGDKELKAQGLLHDLSRQLFDVEYMWSWNLVLSKFIGRGKQNIQLSLALIGMDKKLLVFRKKCLNQNISDNKIMQETCPVSNSLYTKLINSRETSNLVTAEIWCLSGKIWYLEYIYSQLGWCRIWAAFMVSDRPLSKGFYRMAWILAWWLKMGFQ